MGISTSRLCDRRAYRGRIDGEYRMRAPSVASRSRTRRFDGLGQQRTRAAAQDLCEGIGKGPWLGELDDVTVRHGVSLLHWRSGGVEHHHDTPPYPVTPSPTSGHSSDEIWAYSYCKQRKVPFAKNAPEEAGDL